jgi:hypothetical protein
MSVAKVHLKDGNGNLVFSPRPPPPPPLSSSNAMTITTPPYDIKTQDGGQPSVTPSSYYPLYDTSNGTTQTITNNAPPR